MANKSLFASAFAMLTPRADTLNREGSGLCIGARAEARLARGDRHLGSPILVADIMHVQGRSR